MIFIDNKYTNIYNSIVTRGQSREKIADVYYENHHIIPRCLGGSNDADNIVALTAREHFICHLLLTKITDGPAKYKMMHAVWHMTHISKNLSRRDYKITAQKYAMLKAMYSNYRRSVPGPRTGATLSEETKKRCSLAKKGKSVPWNKGVPRTAEVKEKVSATRKSMAGTDGWNVRPSCSKEKADKISKANRGKKWVHNATERRQLDAHDAEVLVNSGWKYGTGPRNYSGSIFT